MKYQSLEELRALAVIRTDPLPAMSRDEKLRRWADLLEARGGSVASLFETEYISDAVRPKIRSNNSAISVAYADPTLRKEGLAGDAYGDAIAFFELNDTEMHRILCYCTGGHALAAPEVARRIRWAARVPATCIAPMWIVSVVAIGGLAFAAAL
jgi:hypothetical protein